MREDEANSEAAQAPPAFVKWAQRCPAEPGDVIEIPQIWDAADFEVKK